LAGVPIKLARMSNPSEIKLPKWPFYLGDAVLLGLAYFIYLHVRLPLGRWEAAFFLFIGTLGTVLAVLPFLLEYFAAAKMVETGALISTVARLEDLQYLTSQINTATERWQTVQEHSNGAVKAAKEISDKMTIEAAGFAEFLKKANDSERANLRLELDKMRRTEADWIQVVVRMLDHTYALYQAAVRSGQAGLIEQLGQFQNSCRDVARRIGLVPFAPATDESFDPQFHRSTDSQADSMADARVLDTIATGYTYQGQMIRSALVTLQNPLPTGLQSAKPELAGKIEAEVEEEQTLL
jgi:molecular chaperone GrpE (heat shock protein)